MPGAALNSPSSYLTLLGQSIMPAISFSVPEDRIIFPSTAIDSDIRNTYGTAEGLESGLLRHTACNLLLLKPQRRECVEQTARRLLLPREVSQTQLLFCVFMHGSNLLNSSLFLTILFLLTGNMQPHDSSFTSEFKKRGHSFYKQQQILRRHLLKGVTVKIK